MASQAAEDDVLARLAAFVAARQAQPADAFARTAAAGAMALRLADALACALAAHKGDALHALAADFGDARGPAQVFGGGRANLENAAFLNCVMIRELDWNDTYIGKNGGHPSDFSGGALAAAAFFHRSGAQLLQALAAGNHVMLDFCDAASAISRGWDPATYVSFGAVTSMGMLAGLDREQMRQALAMTAVTAPVLLGRTGKVTGWKGLACAVAVRQALFNVMLARNGVSGPEPVFAGPSGFAKVVSGALELQLDADRDRSGDSHLKLWPAIYHAQGPVEMCLAVHGELQADGAPEISEAQITIYDFALRFAADTPDKWSPANLETADHSLPFIAAHCLMRGEFGLGSLRSSLHDAKVRALAAQMRIAAGEEFSAHWPRQTASRLRVAAGGKVYEKEIRFIRGHDARPLGLDDVEAKFIHAADHALCSRQSARQLLDRILNIGSAQDVASAGLMDEITSADA